eukprot:4106904-Lingulodinium_polyedra.AAC.1
MEVTKPKSHNKLANGLLAPLLTRAATPAGYRQWQRPWLSVRPTCLQRISMRDASNDALFQTNT